MSTKTSKHRAGVTLDVANCYESNTQDEAVLYSFDLTNFQVMGANLAC